MQVSTQSNAVKQWISLQYKHRIITESELNTIFTENLATNKTQTHSQFHKKRDGLIEIGKRGSKTYD